MKLSLSRDQKQALEELVAWLRSPNDHITLGGYAGTGKTTLLGVIRQIVAKSDPQNKTRVAFASYTGQATQNLQNRLAQARALYPQDSCSTIHRLMYYQVTDGSGGHVGWKRRARLDFDLIIIDEASMIDQDVWQDLCYYGIPILAVGDHGQLPPINSAFHLLAEPQVRLETIHRQAETNPILKLATQARLGKKISHGKYSSTVRKIDTRREDVDDLLDSLLAQAGNETLVLTGRNKTRVRLNQRVRQLRGMETQEPVASDIVVCLKNNYENEDGPIYNGMVGQLVRLSPVDEHWYTGTVQFIDEDRVYTGLISRQQFGSESGVSFDQVKRASKDQEESAAFFDFGYALTVHKAQGSQAKRVVLFDESYCFREEASRWLYTAITRAEEELYIFS